MNKTPNRLLISIAILVAAFTLQTAHAGQAIVPASSQTGTHLPDIDRGALIKMVKKLRSQLIERKQVLVQAVADKKMDSGDAVITAIMPGGLLYAGYKKLRYDQAKNELERVSADIDEFSADLLAMQSMSTPVVIAQLP
ncbi:MAG: hypothetical protein WBN57_04260 [Gammaproteobacteria bacterium]